MSEWLGEPKRTKARKPRACHWCNGTIKAGEIYVGWFCADGWSGMTVNIHTECYEAVRRASAETRYEELYLDGTQPRGLTEWEESSLLATGTIYYPEQKPFWPQEAPNED